MLNLGEFFMFDGYALEDKEFRIENMSDRLDQPNPKDLLKYDLQWAIETRIELFLTDYYAMGVDKRSHFSIFRSLTFFYKCNNQSCPDRILFMILLKFLANSYRGWRHFLKLPVHGSRTWSNHKSQKKSSKFFEYYIDFFLDKRKLRCNRSRKKPIMYAEFVNKFYYFQFREDWLIARSRLLKFERKNAYVGWRYDLRSILANRVYIHLEKKEKKLRKNKKKKQKKKVKIKNNLFNIGFDFLYCFKNERKVFRHFFVVKRTFQKKKKKKKK